MKILLVSASYKPAYIYGGPIMSVSMLAEQLVKSEMVVSVFTTTANGPHELTVETKRPQLVDGVMITYFHRVTKDHTQFSPSLLLKVWKNAKDFDVIHIQAWWNLTAVLSCLLALWQKIPVVVSPRGTLSNYTFSNKNNFIKRLIHQLLSRPLLRKCFIHTTSEHEYQSVKKIITAKHFFNISNFIRLTEEKKVAVPIEETHLRLIFFSRIEEKKGLDILLNALKNVDVPYRLTVAGNGDPHYVNLLKNIARKNNIDGFIDWVGFQGENKFGLLGAHDLFVLPSHDENFGNAVVESLSVGTAVLIGENVGLANYVVENNMGWVCQITTKSVSEAIDMVNKQRTDLKRIRNYAPGKILKDFDADQLVNKYITMYHQIITT